MLTNLLAATWLLAAPAEPAIPYFERPVVEADLKGKSLYELTLMRNTIFARAGNKFRKKWLHEHFTQQSWYTPAGLDEKKLAPHDASNAAAIATYEAGIPRADLVKRRDALFANHAYASFAGTTALAFSTDGKRLLSGHADGRAAIWDVPSGTLVRELDVKLTAGEDPSSTHDFDLVLDAAFTVDGKEAVIGTLGGMVTRFDVATGKRTRETDLGVMRGAKRGALTSLAFSGDGTKVIAFVRGGDVFLGSQKVVKTPSRRGELETASAGFLGAEPFVIVADGEGDRISLQWLDPATLTTVRSTAVPSDRFATSLDGKRLAFRNDDAKVTIHAVAALEKSERTLTTGFDYLDALELSPDGKALLAGSEVERLVAFDATTGKTLWGPIGDSWGEGAGRTIAISGDGRVAIANRESEGDLQLLRLADGKVVAEWKGHQPWPDEPTKIEMTLLSRALGVTDVALAEKDLSPLDDPDLLDARMTVDQLRDLSPRDLRILRNTIYARRGREFQSTVLQEYFGRLEWYKADPKYTEARLTKLDLQNVKLIQSVEKEAGGPLDESDHRQFWFRA